MLVEIIPAVNIRKIISLRKRRSVSVRSALVKRGVGTKFNPNPSNDLWLVGGGLVVQRLCTAIRLGL